MSLLLFLACAPGLRMPGPLAQLGRVPDPPALREAEPAPRGSGSAVARAAVEFIGESRLVVDGQDYRMDCSGLVEAALARAHLDFEGSSAMLHDQARALGVLHHRRVPRPGDVAFFDDTYDRNRNGQLDDPLSHSAVVERVLADGTVEMVHVGSNGVSRLRMNLRRPTEHQDADGTTLNDYLRTRRSVDPPGTRYLAGELWVAFASFYGAEAVASRE